MALGHKSLVKKLKINNLKDPKKPHTILVQANKHYGICDILHCVEPGKKVRVSSVLSVFQGRQYNDEYIMEHLSNVLYEILNRAAL